MIAQLQEAWPNLELLWTDPVKRRLVAGAIALLALALVLAVLRRLGPWFRRAPRTPPADSALAIDLAELPTAATRDAAMTVYHIPARLGVLVIAPLGRDATAPSHMQLARLLDQLLPGLAEVVRHDEAIVRVWPRQLSATGFANSLARHLHLPGDKGRGTRWCLVAGRTMFENAPYGVGMALGAAENNNLGLIVLESDHQWLDVLRLRSV